jgi:hypothetical protein
VRDKLEVAGTHSPSRHERHGRRLVRSVVLDISDKIGIPPERREWPELRRYAGPWQPQAAGFLSAPRLDDVSLRGATQQAFDLIRGPLSGLGLHRPKLSDGSPGWPYPAEVVYIDTSRKLMSVASDNCLLPTTLFSRGSAKSPAWMLSPRKTPLGELGLRKVRSLGETDPWKIQAKTIYVERNPTL